MNPDFVVVLIFCRMEIDHKEEPGAIEGDHLVAEVLPRDVDLIMSLGLHLERTDKESSPVRQTASDASSPLCSSPRPID